MRKTRCPPPPGWGVGFERRTKWLGNLFAAPPGASNLFFRPRRLPRAILDASCDRSCAKPGAKSETKRLGTDLGAKSETPEGRGTFKNHDFPEGCLRFCDESHSFFEGCRRFPQGFRSLPVQISQSSSRISHEHTNKLTDNIEIDDNLE